VCLANCNFASHRAYNHRAYNNVTSTRCMLFISKALLILAMHKIINLVMTERCQVQLSDKFEVIGILKEIDLWNECRQKYSKLFPKRVDCRILRL
jgi:hypothetical protein